jgi:hypothetical protein
LRGGIVLGMSFALPFVGTFLVLPYTLIAGFGAFLVCLRRPRPVAEEAPVLSAPSVTAPAP